MSDHRDDQNWLDRLGIDEEGLLDILLLARRLTPLLPPSGSFNDHVAELRLQALNDTPKADQVATPSAPTIPFDGGASTPTPPEIKPQETDYADPSSSGERTSIIPSKPGPRDETKTGTPFRIPSAAALPNSLEIGQALRALKKRIPASRQAYLDEEETARLTAIYGRPFPKMRFDSERWLEAAIVFDASPEMAPWRPAIDELVKLLERHGAFRDVRAWTLDSKAGLHPGLAPGELSEMGRPHSVLIEPRGRRLILLATVGRGEIWERDGVKPPLIHGWLEKISKTNPVMLLMLLPPYLWDRTAIGYPSRWVRSLRPGTLSNKLVRYQVGLADSEFGPQTSLVHSPDVCIPLLTLTADDFREGARLLAGAETLMPALPLQALVDPVRSESRGGGEDSPGALIRNFRAWSSDEAYRLLYAIAGIPLMLPAINIVQKITAATPTVSAVAEILSSDLVVSTGHEGEYSFRSDDILKTLVQSTPPERTQAIQDAVEIWVARHFGLTKGFAAYVEDAEGRERLPESARRFAAAQVRIHRLTNPLKKIFLSGSMQEFGEMRERVASVFSNTRHYEATGVELLPERQTGWSREEKIHALDKMIDEADALLVLLGTIGINSTAREVERMLARGRPVIAVRVRNGSRKNPGTISRLIHIIESHGVQLVDYSSEQDFAAFILGAVERPQPPIPETIHFPLAKITSLAWNSQGMLVLAGTGGWGTWSRAGGTRWLSQLAGEAKAVAVANDDRLWLARWGDIFYAQTLDEVKFPHNFWHSGQDSTIIDIIAIDDDLLVADHAGVTYLPVSQENRRLPADETVLCCEFSVLWARSFIAGTSEGSILFLDAEKRPARLGDRFTVHDGAVNDLVAGRQTDLVASASSDGTIGLFRARDEGNAATYIGLGGGVCALALSADENRLAALTITGEVTVWDIRGNVLFGYKNGVTWSETADPQLLQKTEIEAGSYFGSLAFHPTAQLLSAAAGDSSNVHLIRLSADSQLTVKTCQIFAEPTDLSSALVLARRLAARMGGIWHVGPVLLPAEHLSGLIIYWPEELPAGFISALGNQSFPVVIIEETMNSHWLEEITPGAHILSRYHPNHFDEIMAKFSSPDPNRPFANIYFTQGDQDSLAWRQVSFLLEKRGYSACELGNDLPPLENDDLLIVFNIDQTFDAASIFALKPHVRILLIDSMSALTNVDPRIGQIRCQDFHQFARLFTLALLPILNAPITLQELADSLVDIIANLASPDEASHYAIDLGQVHFHAAYLPCELLAMAPPCIAVEQSEADYFGHQLFNLGYIVIWGMDVPVALKSSLIKAVIVSSMEPRTDLPNRCLHLYRPESLQWGLPKRTDAPLPLYSADGIHQIIQRFDRREESKISRLRIAVVGRPVDHPAQWKKICNLLGVALALYGYDLVAGNSKDVDLWVKQGFMTASKSQKSGGSIMTREMTDNSPKVEFAYVTEADAVITIGGRGWTSRALRAARTAGKLIIPLATTAGESANFYKKLERPVLGQATIADRKLVPEAWANLGHSNDSETIVASVMALLELAAPPS